MKAVFDANVVVAVAGWLGESHLCLVRMARRRVHVYASEYLLEEIRGTAADLKARGRFSHSPWTILSWFYGTVHLVTPSPLGKQRSRDPKDDPILGTPLAARARIVTHDHDLLDLGKRFGVEIVTPRAFLSSLARPF